MGQKRYPGRHFTTSRSTAARIEFERLLPGTDKPDRCSSPIERHGIGLEDPLVGHEGSLPVTVLARCRKCPECLRHRRRLWTARAAAEIAASKRTWFGTLTVRPEDRFRMELAADVVGASNLSSSSPAQRYGLLADRVGREVTKSLKRLRASGAKFRYLMVFEAHKDGWPHVHLLVHEHHDPIGNRVLEAAWPFGFSKWKLVDQDRGAATYVAKYLAKDALARVRASQHYGDATLVASRTDALLALVVDQRARAGTPPPPPSGGGGNPA